MNQQRWINIGWSQISITPDRPVFNHGQMYQRVSQYVHDPITVTALVLDNGHEQLILLSADMTSIRGNILEKLKKNLSGTKGLDVSKLSFSVTHTHNSSNFGETKLTHSLAIDKEIMPEIDVPDNIFYGDEAEDFLVEKLAEVVNKAWETKKPGGISYAQDYAAVAFNRRPVFENDGQKQSVMYGVCDDPSFKGFEGTSDHTADMLYTWDLNGNLTGIAVNIPCPSQVYELHCFITADYWAPTRNAIREKFGKPVYVLSLCGAGGDQNPLDLVRLSKNNKKTFKVWGGQTGEVLRNFDMALECEDIAQRIADCVVRGFKKARNYIDNNPMFKHEIVKMELPIRKVKEEDYQEARRLFTDHVKKFSPENRMTMKDVVYLFEPQGVLLRYEMQNKTDVFEFDMHVIRLGNIAISTNPFELFTEYGMRIKARSRAEQTFIIQLANGAGGYLPTEAAVAGGSYSSKPASTTCGPDSGDKLVEITLDVMNKMWA